LRRGRETIRYTYLHEHADPTTAMVRNSISFRVLVDGEPRSELPRAFVYEWRLWSIAQLREAVARAGFTSSVVYQDVNVAPGREPIPVADPAELGEDWIVMILARA
jgi:phosphatidylserine/phosphatidylglycerophosphate/cardiolipin synthase-like enzyme